MFPLGALLTGAHLNTSIIALPELVKAPRIHLPTVPRLRGLSRHQIPSSCMQDPPLHKQNKGPEEML